MKTTLRVLYRDTGGNSSGYNISYCNPDATDSQLKQLGQKLNALTTNTFIGVQRTDVTDITAAEVYDYTISVDSTNITWDTETGESSTSIANDIPTGTSVTWAVTGDEGVDITVGRTGSQQAFTAYFTGNTAGTFTKTIAPKSNGVQIANSITFNITVQG